MQQYTITINVGEENGDHGSKYRTVADKKMSAAEAEKIFNHHAKTHETCLFRGARVGKLIAQKGPTEVTPKVA
jgi:hypothetical protein